ncbi:uncharacterized protein FA14DRAFT_66280 [Meira miltonrushii]|uniref:Uncharacterized protein n=1 Tax=Meira miltonrushii TaxID=1280837 RepID=A0A316V8S2_9BASI|nr:uncharacterized protein FA14DRAFT_66280 [Meira miltonrushii]PWN33916.1 hypothetical protein FA14DRAFT_66280 [Meira miltonrushii]
MAGYAPPSIPPPGANGAGPSSQLSHYAPTTTPVPGQPLLRNGMMLVYPHGWRGCPKCHDTGYKYNDPTHPCRKCWQSYGQTFNPLLISSSSLQGAKVLQKPLPIMQGNMPGQFPPPGRLETHPSSSFAGYPGAMSPQPTGTNPFLQPQQTGNPFTPQSTGGSNPFSPQHTGGSLIHPHPTGNASYNAPSHPPPNLPPRQEQPHDDRPQASREDDINEDGEAPPAYELAVAAGPDGVLPPQRSEEQQQQRPNNNTAQQSQQYAPPSHQPPPPQGHYPQHGPHPGQGFFSPPPTHQGGPWGGHPHGGHHRPMLVPYGHIPPPNALVLRPGDPRLGGQLCYKCGGEGVRESFWFGDRETCYVCGGTGRVGR